MNKVDLMRRAAAPGLMLALAALSACAAGRYEPPELEPRIGPDVRIEGGLALARRYCASCHAVEAGADSPRPMAPTFPQLATRFTGPRLEEGLTMVSDLGHGEMPPARLDQAELRDLAVYIDSLD
ncbi:MAG: cytochrome c class [Caulobacter sp.]|jgi:mono/diheme cytochrome c family protein|nr:cytochrome c class [Caulobacter sp.]